MVLFNYNCFTMLRNLFVVCSCRVFFVLERLIILSSLNMASGGCHMMNFNIFTIGRHLHFFDDSWSLIIFCELMNLRLNDVHRLSHYLYMMNRDRHCDITFVRV